MPDLRQCRIHRRERVDGGAVEHGQRAVFFVHNQADFGAAEDDALCACVFQTAYHVLKICRRFGFDLVQAQFFKNDAVDSSCSSSSGTMVCTPCAAMRSV